MNGFRSYHPWVNFLYFLFVIGFSCCLMHPICIAISLICGGTYSAMQNGKTLKLKHLLPMLIATALINPAFNHEGITVLTYLPSGNPLTLESVLYGLCAAGMLASVLFQFSCYNAVMTSDKFIYLFGRVIPALSLVFSMTLRFVPRFAAQFRVVSAAQRGMGRDLKHGTLLQRVKNALTLLSAMTTWAFESAIDTADSMKARGYGLPGRSAYSIFTFKKRDLFALLTLLCLGSFVFIGAICGALQFRFFPFVKAAVTPFGVAVTVAYLLLFGFPILLELWEVRKWNVSKSKL